MIFGPERDEVTGQWRRLHNEELYALYSPGRIILKWISRSGMGGIDWIHLTQDRDR
jgi:hypothetical protein